MMPDKLKSTFIIISLILYSLSLYYPALGCNYFGADSSRYTISNGYGLLISGWLGFLVLNISWLANITYFLTLFLILKNRPKILFIAIVTLILGLTSLLLYFDKTQQIGVYVGFYLWLGSFFMLILYGILNTASSTGIKLAEPRYIKNTILIFMLILFGSIFFWKHLVNDINEYNYPKQPFPLPAYKFLKDLPLPVPPIPYCIGRSLEVTKEENDVIQKIVGYFMSTTHCEIGTNCLLKWKGGNTVNFHTAWKNCSVEPGSTFRCNTIDKKFCCSYEFQNEKVCAP